MTTTREFLNQHLGHSATVEWLQYGATQTSQQRLTYSGFDAALRSARPVPFVPDAMHAVDSLDGPLIPLDRIRAVYCCGEHWSAE